MKFILPTLFVLCSFTSALAQNLYFPPTTNNFWARTSPMSLGWGVGEISDLYDFLDSTDTKAFIVLKDGRMVLEKYFDGFTRNDTWYWASAGKCLTSVAMGVAQQKGVLSIEDRSSDYLGQGWTSAPLFRENRIKVRNQISKNTGLNEDSTDCTLTSCQPYRAPAGTRWAYPDAPYTLSISVIDAATGGRLNDFVAGEIHGPTGMDGEYRNVNFNRVYYSTPRSMARFGLLIQNDGYWDTNPILSDTAYFNAMLRSSSNENLSYGYLWWLNGYASHRLPQIPFLIDGPLLPDAPSSTVAALGKNGQILNVVKDQGLVLLRMGANPDLNTQLPVATEYNNEIWKRMNDIICPTGNVQGAVGNYQLTTTGGTDGALVAQPNPVVDEVRLTGALVQAERYEVELWNVQGSLLQSWTNRDRLDLSAWSPGVYYLRVRSGADRAFLRLVKP